MVKSSVVTTIAVYHGSPLFVNTIGRFHLELMNLRHLMEVVKGTSVKTVE